MKVPRGCTLVPRLLPVVVAIGFVGATACDVCGDEGAEGAAEATKTARRAPEAPAGFTTSNFGLREVQLSWKTPADQPSKYQVERSLSPNGPFEVMDRVSPSRKNYNDKGTKQSPLEDSTSYYYRMVAIGPDGQKSEPTDVLESLTAPPPDPPSKITATAPSSRAVLLRWKPPRSEDITLYVVERAPATDATAFVLVDKTEQAEFLDGGHPETPLADSVEYLYRITSVNRVGSEGPPSAPVSIKTLPPPAVVGGFKAEQRQVRCVPLSWEVHPDADIEKYILYRSDSANGDYEEITTIKGRNATSFLDGKKDPGNLEDDRDYYYIVTAVNDVNAVSPDTLPIKVTTRDKPPVVEDVIVESGRARRVPITWAASQDEKVQGYRVYRKAEGDEAFAFVAEVDGIASTNFVDLGTQRSRRGKLPQGVLEDDTKYIYAVRAFNTADAMSEPSLEVVAQTKVRPAAPVGQVASTNTPGKVDVTWKANDEPDMKMYEVEASGRVDGGFRSLGSVLAAEEDEAKTETRLDPGEVRHYRIKAIDAEGLESDWSALVTGQAKALPGRVAGVEVTYEDGGAQLHWDEVTQDDIDEYIVYKKSLLKWEAVGSTAETRFRLEADTVGKSATFAVRAKDKDGLEGPRSREIKVSVQLVADKP